MLFLLKPIEDWEPWYNRVFCFVICAPTELHARQIASEQSGKEGEDVWMDVTKTRCEIIDPNGPPMVLCRDCAEA